jgi:uncharacterized protein (DUF1697 family)
MNTYIALFRGINVGGNNILPMNELKACLTELGFENIQTYIQSGNVVFDTGLPEKKIKAAKISEKIEQEKGFYPKVIVLNKADFKKAFAENDFDSSDGRLLHLFFYDTRPTKPNLETLEKFKKESECYAFGDKAFYLYAPEGIGRSKLAAGVEKALGVSVTARNWNTVTKLMAMID